MGSYREDLENLDDQLGMYPENNLALLNEYKNLAARVRTERSESAGEVLLSIAYTIGERISSDEDLEPYYRDALTILEEFRNTDSYFAAVDSLAWHLLEKGTKMEALSLFERIVREKADARIQTDYFSLNNLAIAYERNGDLEKALATREQALLTWKDKKIQSGTPDVAFYAQARTETGRVLSLLGKHQEAESHYWSVFEDSRQGYSSHAPFGRWHQDVIDSALDLVCCLFRQTKITEAKEVIVGEMPESTQGLDEMARMFASIARQCYELALKDLEAGREPSSASRPGTIISKGFMSENN